MGARYNANKIGAAISTAADSLTITAPSTRALKIWEIAVYGEGVTSAQGEIVAQRSTGGVTPVAMTPAPLASGSAAAASTVATGWTTHPTLTANTVLARLGVNANGGVTRKVFPPGLEIEVPPSGQVSFRASAGTGVTGIEVIFEEVG